MSEPVNISPSHTGSWRVAMIDRRGPICWDFTCRSRDVKGICDDRNQFLVLARTSDMLMFLNLGNGVPVLWYRK